MLIIKIIASFALSYLFGSIPTGYIFAKVIKGIDIRQHGSGNLGATNVARVLGKKLGGIVLALDILKGTLAVLGANYIFYSRSMPISKELFLCLNAVSVVSGHNWTIFLNFKGGKGIATTLGILIAFSILIKHFAWLVLSSIILWAAIFLTTGFVSLGSIICSLALPIIAIFLHLSKEITAFLAILGAFSVIRHKSNIIRLLQKKESRFNTKNLFRRFK